MGLNSLMTGLADQVRRLSGRTGLLGVAAMTAALEGVETGTDVSGADAATGDVVSGKKFVGAAGTVETGTMPDRGAVSQTLTASTKSYTIPDGRHNGSGVVKINTQTKSATPKTTAQTITPDSGYLLSSVTVGASVGKEMYSGTISSTTNTASVTVDTGTTLGANDIFLMFFESGSWSGSTGVVVSAIRLAASDVRSAVAYQNGMLVAVYGGSVATVSYSGNNVTITSNVSDRYIRGTYRWYVIKG